MYALKLHMSIYYTKLPKSNEFIPFKEKQGKGFDCSKYIVKDENS